MKLSAAVFAFFALPTFVTSIPLLDSVDDGYVSVTAKRLNERNIDKRQLSDTMFNIVNALNVFADEYNHYHASRVYAERCPSDIQLLSPF
ncbi:hypothetical protein M378DRAFT_16093 [Amanita muscaria Koide BX008]|uniref:Uncharacterized protein n=1 Tax=Amanita muscaria (strain Koide BX008) TaxID=946122 RepID=A0A0C2W900_AMAMK|nr:hypothetical protein M378DRAFT_16093 [Amanita muscaria Koide BX008]